MNQKINDFIEGVRVEVVRMERLVGLADVLEEARAAISGADAAKGAAEKAFVERDAALLEVAAAQDRVKDADGQAAAILAKARADADAVASDANQFAIAVADKARADAELVIAAAKDKAQADLQSVTDSRNRTAQNVADLKDEAALLIGKRDELAGEVSELESNLAAVKRAIASLKG